MVADCVVMGSVAFIFRRALRRRAECAGGVGRQSGAGAASSASTGNQDEDNDDQD